MKGSDMDKELNGLQLERLDRGWKIAGYTGAASTLDIPAEVDGVPVVMIGANAFEDAACLRKVTIPRSVTFIGNYAFWNCAGLEQIDLPETISTLHLGTFWGCSSLTHVDIPRSVTTLGDGVFRSCNAIVSQDIPNTVTELGDSCFRNCASLTTAVIPRSVTKIARNAYRDCPQLSLVTIGDSVEYVGPRAFQGCPQLESIQIEGDDIDVTLNAFRNYSLMCFVADYAVPRNMLPFDEAKTLLNSGSPRERTLAARAIAHCPDRIGEIATKLALTRTLAEAGLTDDLRTFEGQPGYLSQPAILKCIDAANARNRTETSAYLLDLLARQDGPAPAKRSTGLEL